MWHASQQQQCNYISSCIRHQSHRLWQLAVRRCAENLERQTAAGHERRRTSHQLHTKIRPGSVAISARGSTLAGWPTTRYVQAVPAGVQVSTWLGTAVSSRALCTGRRRHTTTQASFCHSRTTGFPRYNMKNCGRWAFSYTGLHAWNSLSEHLRQTTSVDLFKCSLKTFLIQADIAFSALDIYLLV